MPHFSLYPTMSQLISRGSQLVLIASRLTSDHALNGQHVPLSDSPSRLRSCKGKDENFEARR